MSEDEKQSTMMGGDLHGGGDGRKELMPPLPDDASELVKYVMVELDVPRQNHHKFQSKMQSLTELMFDYKQWELVFAAYPITSVINRFVHIWRIPDESTVVEIMREGALKRVMPGRSTSPEDRLRDEFRDCYKDVQELIVSTSHTLMTSLSYDPTNVGYQTKTIVVDAKKQAFVIEHSKLRATPSAKAIASGSAPTDISEELAGIRMKFPKVRSLSVPVPKTEDSVSENHQIQDHLNRGVANARLRDTVAGSNTTLLFNLAGLKPRSIYEDLKSAHPNGKAQQGTPPAPETLSLPPGVRQLVIATPWGGVYKLNEHQLRHVAEPVPADRFTSTQKMLKPLIDDLVPIASIPTERYEVVGDGCACYVINLASFATSV